MDPSIPFILAAATAALFASHAQAVTYNGLALTPQMGWVRIIVRLYYHLLIVHQDNWNAFGCDVSEQLLLGTAEKMIDYGLRDLGYRYVILDDCWSDGRTSQGTLQVNRTKFPNGLAYVAGKLHDMGLWFGMYSSAGVYTCGQYGS